MSADVVAYLPALDDPVWIQWQAEQITHIARQNRFGTAGFQSRERLLYAALGQAFTTRLDHWHAWEWNDSIGGIVTIDRHTPERHPYLGVVPLHDLRFEAIAAAQQSLLQGALADARALIGGSRNNVPDYRHEPEGAHR